MSIFSQNNCFGSVRRTTYFWFDNKFFCCFLYQNCTMNYHPLSSLGEVFFQQILSSSNTMNFHFKNYLSLRTSPQGSLASENG